MGVIPATDCHSCEGRNPFVQELLDSCLRRNDNPVLFTLSEFFVEMTTSVNPVNSVKKTFLSLAPQKSGKSWLSHT